MEKFKVRLRRLRGWIRSAMTWWEGKLAMACMGVLIKQTKEQDRLIKGLRADLEAIERVIVEARGETARIEHYVELYRANVVPGYQGQYELKLIPRHLRRSHKSRAGSRGR